ncbi:MAG TPA: hypothetical protein VF333_10640 [Pyrinomonadaceae bacterium]
MRFRQQLFVALVLFVLLCAITPAAFAQSSDQSLPTPVLANEINGRITALDPGDARLTRHFYAFEGTPGDLLITIDGKNLNGDMDIFTAVTFRPLMKTSIYANSQSGEVTKGIYLRRRQILILRVEARTPNDDDGAYHIRFGGSFEPFSGGIPVAENTEPQEDATRPSRGGKRLSSVGAKIAEPVVDTPPAVKPTAENEKPAADTEAAKKSTAPKPANARSTRNPRGRARPAQPKPAPATSNTEAAKTSEAKTEETKKETGAAREEKSGTESAKSETPAKPNAQEAPLAVAHLIIESKDGTKIDRPMSTVRRVVVEGGMIVIVLKTGKIERIPMSAVARMAIEP